MIIPEINPDHMDVIEYQKKRLGTTKGFIAVKPNCSIQSYTPALTAWKEFEPYEVVATTYQAISGAGKNFEEWPEMVGNVIPFISGEEEKSEKEPLRIWGKIENGVIVPADDVKIHVSASGSLFFMVTQQQLLLSLRRTQQRKSLLRSLRSSQDFHSSLDFLAHLSSLFSTCRRITDLRLLLMLIMRMEWVSALADFVKIQFTIGSLLVFHIIHFVVQQAEPLSAPNF
jgi:hypothetical protein